MFGAIYGDIIGSYFEVHGTKEYDFQFNQESTFTDDSVLTAAVCRAILYDSEEITWFHIKKRSLEYAAQYRQFYSYFPNAGFGMMFLTWAKNPYAARQHSYGNGAAMRVIPIGYAYDSLKQVGLQVKASCLCTHKNREAIKGAEAVASAVWLARHNFTKEKIRDYIETKFRYPLSVSLCDIKPDYVFDSRTSYSVPPSILAFLESHDYESAVRNAVSLGGDADTMACIAGGIAEAFYKEIPEHIKTFCDRRIDFTIRSTIKEFLKKYPILL